MAVGAAGADPRPAGLVHDPQTAHAVREAIAGLDAWFDSMRQPGGYGGPVVHWWRDCLDYTGPGLDWRYEGIIIGYLNLWRSTGEENWLFKAKRAGDDLVAGQLPSGNYRNSGFELNPITGGTPHEAACDLALLRLADALREKGGTEWEVYCRTAELNLRAFYLGRLWDEAANCFWDSTNGAAFVPNKAATLAEALFALADLTGERLWAERYALPTLDAVLDHQVSGGELDGAVCQNSLAQRPVARFFPYYIARCIPGLRCGLAWSGEERYGDAARRAADFILRTRYEDGSFPQVVYPGGQVNRYPQWVAAVGGILCAVKVAYGAMSEWDLGPSLRWLLAGRRSDGGFCTAVGFGCATPGVQADDVRDKLAVCGWNAQAFRWLTEVCPLDRGL